MQQAQEYMLLVFTNSMDYKNAKQKLSELRDSLDEVLGGKSEGPSREDAEEALKAAKDGARRAKKTLLGRVKELPVVDKITQLGAAGTVAVSTAAVTQTNIAVDETEVFVASVANDAVQKRFYIPPILDRIIDFPLLDSWGQKVMQEKVAEVQAEVAKVEAKVASVESQPTEEPSGNEPQAQEESANNTDENGGDAEEAEQDVDEVKGEEIDSDEAQEPSEEDSAEPVPEEESGESVDEVDEIKPHSNIISDESGMIINPNNGSAVSPEQPRQV